MRDINEQVDVGYIDTCIDAALAFGSVRQCCCHIKQAKTGL